MRISTVIAALIATAFTLSSAHANVGEAYGFGSRASALAGAVVGAQGDAFSAYYNPAALGHTQDPTQRFHVSWGVLYMQPQFIPINNVVTSNSFNSDQLAGQPITSSVDTSYKTTFGQVIGLSFRALPEFHNLTFGLVTYLPLEQLAYMDTGEAYIPEYVLYRSRYSRPQFELGAGADIGKGLSLGAGLHIGYTLTSNAPVFINSGSNTTSSMRFASSLTPKAAPYFGLYYVPEFARRPLSFGTVFRFPVAYSNQMQLLSSARLFGNQASADFGFLATSALYYDPMAVEVGGTWQITRNWQLLTQVDYQFWSNFQVPALSVVQTEGPTVAAGILPAMTFQNILVPRLGNEISLSEMLALRVGYAYRPSIITTDPSASGNYLDPAKHMFNLGLNLKFAKFFSIAVPTNVGFNLGYQQLQTKTVVKSPGNEAGVAGDPKIGSTYPDLSTGYQAGGHIFGGGMTLSLAI